MVISDPNTVSGKKKTQILSPKRRDNQGGELPNKSDGGGGGEDVTSSRDFPFHLIFLSLLGDPYKPFSGKQGKIQDVESCSLHSRGLLVILVGVVRYEEGSFTGTASRPRSHVKSIIFVFLVFQHVQIGDNCHWSIACGVKSNILYSSKVTLCFLFDTIPK